MQHPALGTWIETASFACHFDLGIVGTRVTMIWMLCLFVRIAAQRHFTPNPGPDTRQRRF